jgi:hypothetical protein
LTRVLFRRLIRGRKNERVEVDMPNDVSTLPEPQPEKVTLTPKPQRQPVPVCTLFDNGYMKVEPTGVGLTELHRLLLGAAAQITERTLQRAVTMERVLVAVQRGFDGFDQETGQAIAAALGQSAQP